VVEGTGLEKLIWGNPARPQNHEFPLQFQPFLHLSPFGQNGR
jgi:hypothetical protein